MAAAWRPRDNDDDEDDGGGGADDDDPHRSGGPRPTQTRSAPRLLILPHNFRSLLVHSIPSSTSSLFECFGSHPIEFLATTYLICPHRLQSFIFCFKYMCFLRFGVKINLSSSNQ
jgi:hypothetical protein